VLATTTKKVRQERREREREEEELPDDLMN
jgi:hypothetical protein